MKYNNEWVIDLDEDFYDFLFFYGHHPSKNGDITKTCLSQWWEDTFEVDGNVYKTAEHWMMVGKAKLFNDFETIDKILLSKTPSDAKKLGRSVKNFDAKIWDEFKFKIVVEGNLHKFSQNNHLKKYLLSTDEKILVEASPYDNIWGIGMDYYDNRVKTPKLWQGENLLGWALMEVRDLLTN